MSGGKEEKIFKRLVMLLKIIEALAGSREKMRMNICYKAAYCYL
jgi:hypothetical protein